MVSLSAHARGFDRPTGILEFSFMQCFPVRLLGEYPAVVNGANGKVLEIPDPSVSEDLDGHRSSRVLAVGYSLAELPCINLSIIRIGAEVWAHGGAPGSLLSFLRSSQERIQC